MIYEEFANRCIARSEKLAVYTAIILDQIAGYQETRQPAAETVFAASLHVNLLSHDVMALLLLHSVTDDKWINRTAARMVATVIYEGANDLQQLFGKPFRDACSMLGILNEIKNDLGIIKKEMSIFQKRHELVLKSIRMASGAHRDHDVSTFLGSFLDESKTTDVVYAAVDLEKCLQSWEKFCRGVMDLARKSVDYTEAKSRE